MSLRVFLTAMAIAWLAAGCLKSVKRPNLSKGFSGEDAHGLNSEGGTKTPAAVVVGDIPAEIQLVNTKFTGEESQLEATVKYAGTTNAHLKLAVNAGLASIKVPGLVASKADTLIVEMYAGDKLRYIAHRANTSVEKGQTIALKIEDCSVSKLPWDGENNENTCGWSVQDSK